MKNNSLQDYELTMITSPETRTTNEKEQAINKLIEKVEEEAVCTAITINNMQYHSHAKYAHRPHIMFQIVKGIVSVLVTADPTYLHFYIARAAIQAVDKSLIDETDVVDKLARELIKFARTLNSYLVPPDEFKKVVDYNEKDQPFSLIEGDIDEIEKSFEKNGRFMWDNAWLKLLSNIGKYGREKANSAKEQRNEKLKQYKNDGKIAIGLWVNIDAENKDPFYHSTALIIIAEAILYDKIINRVRFGKKNVPSVITSINTGIKQITSPHNKYDKIDEKITLLHGDNIIGATIPTIDSSVTNVVFRGIQKLRSVTGHRVIRSLIHTAFNKMAKGDMDYRTLIYDRGSTEIAEMLNLNGKKYIIDIKDILHALAYTQFYIGNFSGNLIQLGKYTSTGTNRRNEQYRITVGEPLLPHYAFKAHDENVLLIPIFSDPPLVNPTQYHASQYHLQMELASEFSRQSIDLHQHGAIYIPETTWQNLGKQSGLNTNTLNKVRDRWVNDGYDAPKFLEKVDTDFYTLGPAHEKVLSALKDQGERRFNGHLRGKESAKGKQR